MSRSKRNAALQACIVTIFSFEFTTHDKLFPRLFALPYEITVATFLRYRFQLASDTDMVMNKSNAVEEIVLFVVILLKINFQWPLKLV